MALIFPFPKRFFILDLMSYKLLIFFRMFPFKVGFQSWQPNRSIALTQPCPENCRPHNLTGTLALANWTMYIEMNK